MHSNSLFCHNCGPGGAPMSGHLGAMPGYPGAMPGHPGAMPGHPGSMGNFAGRSGAISRNGPAGSARGWGDAQGNQTVAPAAFYGQLQSSGPNFGGVSSYEPNMNPYNQYRGGVSNNKVSAHYQQQQQRNARQKKNNIKYYKHMFHR